MILQPGVTLAQIAYDEYGSVLNFRDIADANGIDIFTRLPVGDDITLPTQAEVIAAVTKAADLAPVKQAATALGETQLISWII